jgi:hypothetical protein
MGEALSPGAKVGTQFKKGTANLMGAAEEIRAAVSTTSRDIVVIVDGKLRAGKIGTAKTAEILKAAGWAIKLISLVEYALTVCMSGTMPSSSFLVLWTGLKLSCDS